MDTRRSLTLLALTLSALVACAAQEANDGAEPSAPDASPHQDAGTKADAGSAHDARAEAASGDDAGGDDDDDASAGGDAADDPFHLAAWQIQLPTGSAQKPDIITPATGVHNDYFYVDKDGSLTFMDPETGWTTPGSDHPRSELRELTNGWPGSGTNALSADVQVTTVPSKVTIGQIFQAPPAPSKPLLELEYLSDGTIKLLLERDNQGGNGGLTTITNVGKGTRFQYRIELSKEAITISINGKATPYDLPPTFQGEAFYFKAGAYDQTASEGTPGTTPGTIVKFFALTLEHS